MYLIWIVVVRAFLIASAIIWNKTQRCFHREILNVLPICARGSPYWWINLVLSLRYFDAIKCEVRLAVNCNRLLSHGLVSCTFLLPIYWEPLFSCWVGFFYLFFLLYNGDHFPELKRILSGPCNTLFGAFLYRWNGLNTLNISLTAHGRFPTLSVVKHVAWILPGP